MTLKGGATSACAACRYQRRMCIPECLLAPYFPADRTKVFQNAHKLFGVSNILKILRSLDPSQHAEAMRSIKYQANVRDRFPVYGCLGVINQLNYQIQLLEEEFHVVLAQLEMCRRYHHRHQHPASSIPDDVASQLELGVSPYCDSNSNSLWIQHPPLDNENDQLIAIQSQLLVPNSQPLAMQQEVVHDYDEIHPLFDTIDDRQSYIDTKEAYDFSCEESAKETTQATEHFAENTLKNAAACFSLTSVN